MTDQTATAVANCTTTATSSSGSGRPHSPADMSVDSVPAAATDNPTKSGVPKVDDEEDNNSYASGSGFFDNADNNNDDDDASDYDASATFDDSGSVENDDEYSYEYVPSDEEGQPRRRFEEDSDSDSEDEGEGGNGNGNANVIATGAKHGDDGEEEKKTDDVVPVPSLLGGGASLTKADSDDSEDVSPRDAKRPALEHPHTNTSEGGGGLTTPPSSVPVSPDRARRLQQLQQRQDKQIWAGLVPRTNTDPMLQAAAEAAAEAAATAVADLIGGGADPAVDKDAIAAAARAAALAAEADYRRMAAEAAEDIRANVRASEEARQAALASGATAEEARAAARAARLAAMGDIRHSPAELQAARAAARAAAGANGAGTGAAAGAGAGAAAGTNDTNGAARAAGTTTAAAAAPAAAPPRPPPTPCPNPKCPHEAHAPISCDQMATWNETCRVKTSGILTVPSPSVQYCMEHMIESISDILEIPPAGVAVLLRENGWDPQTLMTGNPAALIRRSGVSHRCRDAANRHDNNHNNNAGAGAGGGGGGAGGGSGGTGGTGGAGGRTGGAGTPGSPFRGGAGHLLDIERRTAAASASVFGAAASSTAVSAAPGIAGARPRPSSFGGRPGRGGGGGGWGRMAAATAADDDEMTQAIHRGRMAAATAADDDEMMAQAIEASLHSEEDRKARRALEAKRRHGVEMRIGQTAPEFAPHLDPVNGAATARSSAAGSSTTAGTGARAAESAALARSRASIQRTMEQLQRSESENDSFFLSSDGDSLGDDEALPGNAFHAAAASRKSAIDTNSGPAASGKRAMFSRIFSSRTSSSGGGTSFSSKPAPELKKQASQERRKAFEDARAAAAAAAARAAAEEEEKAEKKAASAFASEGEDSDAKVDNNNGDGTSADEDMDNGKRASDDSGDADGKKTAIKDAGDKKKHDGLLTCEICFNDELTEADILPFPCRHKYCRDCWKGLITSMLQSTGEDGGGGGNVDTILSTTCPSVGCNECITEVEVKELCPDLLPALRRLQMHSFVAGRGMESLRWCPGPDCDRVAVRCRRDLFDCVDREIPTGSCGSCNTSFCFQCGEQPHPQGETCTNADANADDDLFGGMGGKSGAPIKHCPKCKVKIEKNGGCNHMRCKCGHHFCWICLGDYRGRHFCGREGGRQNAVGGAAAANAGNNAAAGGADGTAAQGTANARAVPNFDLDYLHTTIGNSKAPDNDADREALATFLKDKEAMDHFAHYYNRFAAHNQGQEYAETQTHCTENRVNEYGKTTDIKTANDSNFIADANKTLVDCRRVLKYSYAYSYCNDDDAHKELFLVHVERLERFVEDLSLESESAITAAGREKVINLINIVEKSKEAVEGYIDFGATFTARGGKMM